MIKVVIIVMLTAQLICAVADADQTENSVSISGPITLDWIDYFEEAYSEGKTRFRISSEGGREIEALIVSEFVSNIEVEIIVDKYCLSSCAQYLLPSAKKVFIMEGALIGLHHSSYSILRLPGIERERIANLDELNEASRLTERLFEKVGAKLSMLDDSIIQSEVNCIEYGSPYTRVYLKYSFWIPSANTMIENGINLIEYPDYYSADIYYSIQEILELSNTKFRIGEVGGRASLGAVKECR